MARMTAEQAAAYSKAYNESRSSGASKEESISAGNRAVGISTGGTIKSGYGGTASTGIGTLYADRSEADQAAQQRQKIWGIINGTADRSEYDTIMEQAQVINKQFKNYDYQADRSEYDAMQAEKQSLEKQLEEINNSLSYAWTVDENDALQTQRKEILGRLNKIKESERASEQYDREAKGLEYSSLRNNKDFALYSGIGMGIGFKDHGGYSVSGNKVNFANEYRDVIEKEYSEPHIVNRYSGTNNLWYLTPDEEQTYYYILAKEGEEKADEFLYWMQDTLNYRSAEKVANDIERDSGASRVAREIAAGLLSGNTSALAGLSQNLQSDARATTSDEFLQQMIQQNIAKRTGTENGGHSIEGIASSAANTIGNMIPSMSIGVLNPAAGAVTLGLSTKGNTYKQLLDEGYSKEQAEAVSIPTGIAEASLQYALGGISSLGGKVTNHVVEKATSNISNSIARSLVKLGVQNLDEVAEELLQNKIGTILRNGILGENNSLSWNDEDWDTVLMTLITTTLLNAPSTIGSSITGSKNVQGIDQNKVLQDVEIPQNSQTNSVANAVKSAEQQTANAESPHNAPQNAQEAQWNINTPPSTQNAVTGDSQLFNTQENTTPEVQKNTARQGAETSHVIDSLRENIPNLSKYPSVSKTYSASVLTIEGKNIAEKARTLFERIKGTISRPGFGDIEINTRSVKDDLSHGIGMSKAAVIPSIPEVIKNGEKIDFQKNWKGRAYDGYIFAAPVELDGKKVYVAAVVKQTSKNRFYLHEVVDSNGNIIKINGGEEANPTSLASVDGAGAFSPPETPASTDVGREAVASKPSISNSTNNVNGNLLEAGSAVQAQQQTDYQFRPGDTGETTRTVERGTSLNFRTNENTDPVIRQMLDDAPLVYQQISNKKTFNQAKKIFDKSFDDALATVEGHLVDARTQNKKLAVEDVPLSYMVANELAKRGEVDRAMNIISNLAAELTYYGQANQANIIMRNASPVTKAKAMQNLVNKLNNDLTSSQKKKNVKKGLGTETGEIVLDNGLLQEYINAADDTQRNAVIDKINQSIADQMPPTLVEQFNAMRYANMLGNFKTIERNVTGNALFYVLTKAKNRNNVLLGKLVNTVKPGTVEKTGVLFVDKDLKKQARADADTVLEQLKGNGKFRDNLNRTDYSAIQDKRKILPSPLEQYRNGVQWMLDNKYFGDESFLKLTYSDALAGYIQARGYKDLESVPPDIMENAREYAINEAQEATFRDSNVVSDSVSRFGRSKGSPKALNIVSEGILPFRKTPANVLVRALEYSPVGVGESVIKAFQTKSGKTNATDVVNSLSKSLTGSAILAAGIYAGIKGFARTKDDDEDLEKYRKMQGYQDYSINIGGHSVSLSQLAPAAVPFFMGVELSKAWSDGKLDLEDLPYIASAISGPLLEMSMLSGINDTLSNLSDYNNSQTAIFRLFMNATMSYLTQGLTNSLIGQFEQASEEYRQTSYTDKDASFLGMKIPSWMQYSVSKAAAKIPGIDFQQQDYVDEFGRKQSNGSTGWRYLNALFNPFYSSEIKTTPLDSELERLHEVGKNVDGFPNVLPDKASRSTELSKGFTMSPDEYQQYSIDRGTMSEEYLNQLIQSPYYQNLSDEQKAETISKLYSVSADRASKSVLENNGIEYTGKMDDIAGLSDVPGYYSYYSIMQDASDKKPTTDWQSVMKMMQGFTSMPEDVKTELKGNSDMHLKAVEYATNNGLSPEDWYSTYDVIKDAKVKTGSEAQVVAAIAINGTNKNLSDADKLMMLQSQLPLAKDGSIPTIVRRYDVAMNSFNISFDDWTKFESALKDKGSTSQWTIRSCAQSVGINPDEAVKVYKTLYKDPKYTEQVNEEFLYLNPLDENGEVAPMSFTDYYNSFNEDQQQQQGTTTGFTPGTTPGMTEIDYQNLIRMSRG